MNYITSVFLMQVYVYPHASTAISRTRSCMILVIRETDRWSAGSDSQLRLKKFMLTSSCSSVSGLMQYRCTRLRREGKRTAHNVVYGWENPAVAM